MQSTEDFIRFKHQAIHILRTPWELLEKENSNNDEKEKCQKSQKAQRFQEDLKKKKKDLL